MFRFFNIFRSTKPASQVRAQNQPKEWREVPLQELLQMEEEEFQQYIRDSSKHFSEKEDFLGFAAAAKHEALAAVKAKRYDEAWRLFHEQKINYMKHAARKKFTRLQTLALDGTVSEHLANVLRLEAKHAEALAHIIYWAASSGQKHKRHDHKLHAYFKRARFENAELGDVERFLYQIKDNPEFPVIQDQIRRWR